jgi:hypothetical protein
LLDLRRLNISLGGLFMFVLNKANSQRSVAGANAQRNGPGTNAQRSVPNASTKHGLLSASLLAAALLASSGQAQTLSRFAPADAIATIELNDLAGVRTTAKAFVAQVESLQVYKDFLKQLTSGNTNDSKLAQQVLGGFLDREGFVSLHMQASDVSKGNARLIFAARPAQTAQNLMPRLIQDSLAMAKKQKRKVITTKEGSFTMYTVAQADKSLLSFGFNGGLAYASNDAATLRGFLKRASGASGLTALGTTPAYKNAMDAAGAGNVRIFANFRAIGDLIAKAAGELPLEGLSLKPVVSLFATLGQSATSVRFTQAGIESAQVMIPDPRGGDPVLARLLVPSRNVPLKAASVVPAGVLGFGSSNIDINGYYDWISSIVDKTGLNPGGLDGFLRKQLKLDLKKDLFATMTGEVASATFGLASNVGTPGLQSAFGEAAFYFSVTDETAAKAGLAKVLPKLVDSLNQVSGTAASLAGAAGADIKPGETSFKSETTMFAGVEVTKYNFGEGVDLFTASKSGYLILASSKLSIEKALADGPRLSDSEDYKKAIARVPAGAFNVGYSYADTPSTLKITNEFFKDTLLLALQATADLNTRDSKNLTAAVDKLLSFAASRTGIQVQWTENTAGGTRTKSFQPVRW